jgi:(2Fe-2S) ferredoxin
MLTSFRQFVIDPKDENAMRNMGVFSVLIALVLLAGFPIAAQEVNDVRLTLERTACFGVCPVYTVTIYADGTVIYEGTNFVDITGKQTANIGPETVDRIVAIFAEAGYFTWEDEYTQMLVTDLPSAITSVTHEGETKRIVRYEGDDTAPIELPYLERWIDEIASTSQWVGQEPPYPYFMSAGAPIITLERQPCFGMCPVYSLVLHEDGTVVYRGLDHVREIGIRVVTVDAQAVTGLAQEMTYLGYFGWEDEYTQYLVTDHAYVITSLMWEGQSKHIVRYDGDPNAPVGLVRIEDRIDLLVNSAQWQ